MYVGPQFRRAGVASAILTGLEDGARSLGYGALRLETGIRQPQAIALYQSFGYRPIPYFDGYVGIDVSRCFEKDLDSRLGE